MIEKSTEQIEADYQTQQKLRLESEKKARLLSEEKELLHLAATVNAQYEQLLANYRAEKTFYTELLGFLKAVNTREDTRRNLQLEILNVIKAKLESV